MYSPLLLLIVNIWCAKPQHVFYRHPCVATEPIMFYFCLFFYFFLYWPFVLKTTLPILTKFSGIVYSGVIWIIR